MDDRRDRSPPPAESVSVCSPSVSLLPPWYHVLCANLSLVSLCQGAHPNATPRRTISELISDQAAKDLAHNMETGVDPPEAYVHPADRARQNISLIDTNTSLVSVGMFRYVNEQHEATLAPILGALTAQALRDRLTIDQQNQCVAASDLRMLHEIVRESVKPGEIVCSAGLAQMEADELRRQLKILQQSLSSKSRVISDLQARLLQSDLNNKLISQQHIRVTGELTALQVTHDQIQATANGFQTENIALLEAIDKFEREQKEQQLSHDTLKKQMEFSTRYHQSLSKENANLRSQLCNGDAHKLRFTEAQVKRLKDELRRMGTALQHLLQLAAVSKLPQDVFNTVMAGKSPPLLHQCDKELSPVLILCAGAALPHLDPRAIAAKRDVLKGLRDRFPHLRDYNDTVDSIVASTHEAGESAFQALTSATKITSALSLVIPKATAVLSKIAAAKPVAAVGNFSSAASAAQPLRSSDLRSSSSATSPPKRLAPTPSEINQLPLKKKRSSTTGVSSRSVVSKRGTGRNSRPTEDDESALPSASVRPGGLSQEASNVVSFNSTSATPTDAVRSAVLEVDLRSPRQLISNPEQPKTSTVSLQRMSVAAKKSNTSSDTQKQHASLEKQAQRSSSRLKMPTGTPQVGKINATQSKSLPQLSESTASDDLTPESSAENDPVPESPDITSASTVQALLAGDPLHTATRSQDVASSAWIGMPQTGLDSFEHACAAFMTDWPKFDCRKSFLSGAQITLALNAVSFSSLSASRCWAEILSSRSKNQQVENARLTVLAPASVDGIRTFVDAEPWREYQQQLPKHPVFFDPTNPDLKDLADTWTRLREKLFQAFWERDHWIPDASVKEYLSDKCDSATQATWDDYQKARKKRADALRHHYGRLLWMLHPLLLSHKIDARIMIDPSLPLYSVSNRVWTPDSADWMIELQSLKVADPWRGSWLLTKDKHPFQTVFRTMEAPSKVPNLTMLPVWGSTHPLPLPTHHVS
jgi:hypothetical protein